MCTTRSFKSLHLMAAIAVASTASIALAADYPEMEPNSTKAEATVISAMAPGDTISGATQGTSLTVGNAAVTSGDVFDITTTAAGAPGIYRYRLAITTAGTSAYTCTIIGLSQSAGVIGTADNIAQTGQNTASGTLPARAVQWYASEQSSRIYYRVTGSGQTTSPYTVTLTRDPITPNVVPMPIDAGALFVSTVGLTTVDTDMWIYDSSFTPIVDAGNDRSTVAQCRLERQMGAGTYIAAISPYNLQNNLASPADDGNRTGTVMDFPNALCANLSATPPIDCDFAIGNRCSGTSQSFTNQTSERFEITFWQFTLTGASLPDPYVFTGGSATPTNVAQGGSTVLKATASMAMPGPVTADLTGFGLSAAEPFHDDGMNGDATAGDGIWSYTLNVPIAQTPSAYAIVARGPSAVCAGATQTITFNVNPPNNTCANAVPIVVGGSYTGTTLGAASSGGGNACNSVSGSGPGVWFVFTETSPTPRRLSANLCDPATDFDANMDVYTTASGQCGAPYACIQGNDNSDIGCPFQQASMDNGTATHSYTPAILNWSDFNVQPFVKCTIPGTTYFIVVSNHVSAAGGHFVLHLTDLGPTCPGTPPANNTCAAARTLTAFPTWDVVFRGDAVDDPAHIPSCADPAATAAHGPVWYKFSPSQAGDLFHAKIPDQAVTQGAAADTVLTVYSASPDCSSLAEVACVDAVEGYASPAFSTPVAHLAAGTIYFLMVSNYSGTVALPNSEYIGFNFVPDAATTGVCCRGSTCNSSVAQADCTGSGTAGADFVAASSACNSGGVSTTPCCYANYNKVNGVNVQDIFDFLSGWFAGSPLAKVGGSGDPAPLAVQDIFNFLSAWFAGGC